MLLLKKKKEKKNKPLIHFYTFYLIYFSFIYSMLQKALLVLQMWNS